MNLIALVSNFHFSGWNIWECRRSWTETNLWRTESYSSWNQAAEPPVRHDSRWAEKICVLLGGGDLQTRGWNPRAARTGELCGCAAGPREPPGAAAGGREAASLRVPAEVGSWAGCTSVSLQISQQELDTVANAQHEILRQVNEMK